MGWGLIMGIVMMGIVCDGGWVGGVERGWELVF